MSEAHRELARRFPERDGGTTAAETESGDSSWTAPPIDLSEPEPDGEQPPKYVFTADQQRLGDRCPEFQDLSERVAEANQRSTGRWPR